MADTRQVVTETFIVYTNRSTGRVVVTYRSGLSRVYQSQRTATRGLNQYHNKRWELLRSQGVTDYNSEYDWRYSA